MRYSLLDISLIAETTSSFEIIAQTNILYLYKKLTALIKNVLLFFFLLMIYSIFFVLMKANWVWKCNLSSSTFHSCSLLQCLIRWNLSKVNLPSERTRDSATKRSNSVSNIDFCFSTVKPCLLCTVITHAWHMDLKSSTVVPNSWPVLFRLVGSLLAWFGNFFH